MHAELPSQFYGAYAQLFMLASYLLYLVIGKKSAGMALGSGMYIAALAVAVFVVLCWRSQPEMAWIDAGWVIARVADKHAIRNITVMVYVRKPVSLVLCAMDAERSVSLAVLMSRPFPTLVKTALVNFSPEAFGDRVAFSVKSVHKWFWATFNPFISTIALRCNGRSLATAALAQTGRVRFRPIILAHVVTSYEIYRLTLDVAEGRVRALRDRSWRSAPAITKFYRIVTGGIIGHVGSLPGAIDRAPGRCRVAGASLFPDYTSNTLARQEWSAPTTV